MKRLKQLKEFVLHALANMGNYQVPRYHNNKSILHTIKN